MDNARLFSSPLTRLTEARRSSALFATTLFSVATLCAPAASAALREYRMQFQPSPSSDATGYTMHIGTESGDYQAEFDLGSPPPQGGEVIYSLDLEDSVDLFVALRSYDLAGETSAFSNEVRVSAIPVPAPPPTTGGSGGDDGGNGGGDDGANGGDTGGGDDGSGGDSGSNGGDSGSDNGGDSDGGFGDGMGNGDGTPVPLDGDVGLGLGILPGGFLSQLLGDQSLEALTSGSLAGNASIHPSRCDLDGDDDLDLVVGFDKRGKGNVAILLIEDGEVVQQQTFAAGTEAYREKSGATWPACGDLDGDGRGEIVVGFGLTMRGTVQILDDVSTGPQPLIHESTDVGGFMQVPVPRRYWGPIFPALGDVDGDGRDEIVAGLGRTSIGRIVVLDDARSGFEVHAGNEGQRPWLDIMKLARKTRMRAMPALGDFDGDGKDEIAVSFGTGSGGRVAILDDAERGFPTRTDDVWIVTAGREGYQADDGATRSAFGDLDGDGVDELVVGFMRDGAHEVQVFDDMLSSMRPMGGMDGFVAAQTADTVVYPAPLD
ncbi:MAG: FG-GAP repeat domain-containing protein [Myxococcota bacterium]